ncbi:Lrp/AsnC family transcriptional regulator [Mesorhizobium sp. B2-1-3A]|uniref:Lrp/AsnC family transcriptional regulator n=1 Tax=Mesorhizobium sp. B2-1-3A TaxID=2589971 RepID=UPI0032B1BF0C
MPRETRREQDWIRAGGHQQFEVHGRFATGQRFKVKPAQCQAEALGIAKDPDRSIERIDEHCRYLEYVHSKFRSFVQHGASQPRQAILIHIRFLSFLPPERGYCRQVFLQKTELTDMSSVRKRRQTSGELDVIDRKILSALQGNARLTNNELAEQVGLSPSPCWTRVRRLEANGTIEGYTAVIDQSALGLGDIVFIEITLQQHDEHVLQQFGSELARIPEVLECHLVTGDYDYLVKVAVAGTADYERFLRERLYRINGIRHSRSTFSLRALKRVVSVDPLAVG